MSTYTITSGHDTYGFLTSPSANTASSPLVITGSGSIAYVYLPIPTELAGSTVASATLTGYAAASFTAQTLTLKLPTASWAASALTWNNQPATGASPSAATASGTGAIGAAVVMDATSLMQAVASGQSWYGFQIASSAGPISFASFDSGSLSWVLTIVVSDAPDIPQALVPNGTIVAQTKPTLTCDFTDNGGLSTSMGAIQVQIDPNQSTTFPTFDSHMVAATLPLLDLSIAQAGTAVISTNATTTITAATQTFSSADVGATITGTGIPGGATISAVASGTSATLSAAATATGTPTVTITKTYVGLGAGAATFWRVRVQDTSGLWSGWSTWAGMTYQAQGTITINTPAAGVLWDPTSLISATSSSNMSKYRVQVTAGTDRTNILYDSGVTPANPAALTAVAVVLPEKYEGNRVLVDSRTYQLHVRTWDTYLNRQSTPGSPEYVDSWSTFTLNDDLTQTPIATLTTSQPNASFPPVQLTWTRASAPDGWLVLRDSKIIAKLNPADVISGVSTYTWTDQYPQPWIQHIYDVRATTLVSGVSKRSGAGPLSSITPDVHGIHLYTADGQHVVIDAVDVSQMVTNDRLSTYKPINLPYDVDVVTGHEGLSGQMSGGIIPSGVDTQTPAQTIAVLASIRANPSTPVKMVYGLFSGSVLLRNISVTPSSLGNVAIPLQSVSFTVNQVADF